MRGSIKRRSKGSWTLIFDLPRSVDGKRRQKWVAFHGTKREAQQELTRILRDMDQRTYVEPTSLSTREYLETWLRHIRAEVSGKTFERYTEIVQLHLIPALGAVKLSDLQPLHIMECYAAAQLSGRIDGRGGLSAQTVLHHHRVLRSALNHAVRLGILPNNPADRVRAPRPTPRRPSILNEHQAAALLQALENTRPRSPTAFAMLTGVRRGELVALQWSDVDIGGATALIRQSVEQTNDGIAVKSTKSGKARRIVLPHLAVAELKAHRARQAQERLQMGSDYQNNDLVFPLADGAYWRPDSLSSSFKSAALRAGLGHTNIQLLRHFHATILLKQGVSPKVVSERLGHADVSTTLRVYSHVIKGMQEEAAAQIDAVLGRAIAAQTRNEPDAP